jgi:dihydrofolate reductase
VRLLFDTGFNQPVLPKHYLGLVCSMPRIILIAALACSNRVIGRGGKLPWSIPEDLKRFQQLTLNHTVIMGRKTWEFDLEKRPLKNRFNLVVSSTLGTDENLGIQVARSLSQALEYCRDRDQVFIGGGASLYAQAFDLGIVNTLELTLIEGHYEGDVFFPPFRHLIETQFELVKLEPREGYRFETYYRMNR